MKITLKDLEKMKRDGTIRGFTVPDKQNKCKDTGGRVVSRHWEKRSKEKDYIGWNLLYICNENMLELQEEYVFHPDRKFRFDWFIPGIKTAVEFEGLMSEKSRHTTVTGYSKDTQKYNLAAAMGFTVLRYTALTYKNLINDLNDILKSKPC
jgi:hypothetical protein